MHIILLAVLSIFALLVLAIRIDACFPREECHNADLTRDELKAALTEKGIAFANNAPTEKLQALLDGAGGEDVPAPEAEGKSSPGQEKAAAPAAETVTAPVEVADDAIPEMEIFEKMQAGLSREQSIEVITNQRAWDKHLASQA